MRGQVYSTFNAKHHIFCCIRNKGIDRSSRAYSGDISDLAEEAGRSQSSYSASCASASTHKDPASLSEKTVITTPSQGSEMRASVDYFGDFKLDSPTDYSKKSRESRIFSTQGGELDIHLFSDTPVKSRRSSARRLLKVALKKCRSFFARARLTGRRISTMRGAGRRRAQPIFAKSSNMRCSRPLSDLSLYQI